MTLRVRLPGFWLLLATTPAWAGTSACDDLRGGAISLAVDWQTQVKPILNAAFGGRCSGCHFAGRHPDLSDTGADAIYKIVGSYVIPGRPLESGLFDKVNCAQPYVGGRMPLGGTPLTLEQQALIYDWIAQGALGDVPGEAPIERDFVFRDGAESLR